MEKIKNQLLTSLKPITSVIQNGDTFKVIAVGLNKDVALKKHKAPGKAKILVIQGKIEYSSQREIKTLNFFDEYDIPLEEFHEVIALEPSIFLLIVG